MNAGELLLDPRVHELVDYMKRVASVSEYDGRVTAFATAYIRACRKVHFESGSVLLFTRDSGMHSSGWFKNPDYERCLHLSVSFRDPETGAAAGRNEELCVAWAKVFFGDDLKWGWRESAKSPEGKQLEVEHWRVFCDAGWQAMKPRGEVYTMMAEKGWQSASERGATIISPLNP